MGLQDRPTVPPPPDMSPEFTYLNARIGDLRQDLNEEFGKLYKMLGEDRQDMKQHVSSVLDQYQKLVAPLQRRVDAMQKAIEEAGLDIHFDNGGV